MRHLKLEEVFLIHERILDKFGGARGLRDIGLLDSAVNRPLAAFEGKDIYHDIFFKAAVLGYSLTRGSPFVDANKRTAWEAMHTFIEENGYLLTARSEEVVELIFGLRIKASKLSKLQSGSRVIRVKSIAFSNSGFCHCRIIYKIGAL